MEKHCETCKCIIGHWVILKAPYYSNKKDVIGREGVIVGESRDKKMWRIRWKGTTGIFNYPKENIEI